MSTCVPPGSFTLYVDIFFPIRLILLSNLTMCMGNPWRVSYKKKELLALREHLCPPPPGLVLSVLLIFVVVCVVLSFCVLFAFVLCFVCPMLPDCSFLIDTSVFSNVYLLAECTFIP